MQRLDGEAKGVGFRASQMFPAFYFLRKPVDAETEAQVVAVMTTHVDDLLFAFLPEGEEFVEKLLGKFDIGTRESREFRYCGKSLDQTETASA